MRNASLRKKLTYHSSSPCSMKGREGWPGHGLCTLWLGELFTFQHILCAFVPHCTSTEEWAVSRIKYLEVSGFFASSHDISGDRPASASMRVRAPGEPGKKEFWTIELLLKLRARALSPICSPSPPGHLLHLHAPQRLAGLIVSWTRSFFGMPDSGI